MVKRILAWILLIGFVLLLVNILFIGYERVMSAILYAVIAAIFLFTNRKGRKS